MAANKQLDDFKVLIEKQLIFIDDKLKKYDAVAMIEQKYKVRPSFLALGVILFLILFLFWGVGSKLIGSIVGFLYPLYQSFQTLKPSNVAHSSPQQRYALHTQWLTYWVVYSSFNLIESLTSLLTYWIPLYHLVKIAFLVWCMAPQTKGASVIYESLILPVLTRFEPHIDNSIDIAARSASRVASDVQSNVGDVISSKKKEMVNAAISSLTGGQEQAIDEPGAHFGKEA